MKYVIGNEKIFYDFVKSIKKDDKVAIISHNDVDGVISPIVLEEILKRMNLSVDYFNFINYSKGMFDSEIDKMKEEGITKVFLTDMNADESDIDGFERLREDFDVFLIDHHPVSYELKNKDNIIKTGSSDCSAFTIYILGREFFDLSELDWLVCSAMIADWSFNSEENLKFILERYLDFDKDNIESSEIGRLMIKISNAIVYFKSNLKKVYDFIKEKNFNELTKGAEMVQRELERCIEKYKEEAEFNEEKGVYFAYFNSSFGLTSIIVTLMSKEDYDKVYFLASDDRKNIKVSARCQSGRVDLNYVLRKSIEGFNEATAGGHKKASAALIMKKDLGKFKERLLEFI
ncbi:MAG: DHH family phosphoesterase [Nanoarchaeota archaeon]